MPFIVYVPGEKPAWQTDLDTAVEGLVPGATERLSERARAAASLSILSLIHSDGTSTDLLSGDLVSMTNPVLKPRYALEVTTKARDRQFAFSRGVLEVIPRTMAITTRFETFEMPDGLRTMVNDGLLHRQLGEREGQRLVSLVVESTVVPFDR